MSSSGLVETSRFELDESKAFNVMPRLIYAQGYLYANLNTFNYRSRILAVNTLNGTIRNFNLKTPLNEPPPFFLSLFIPLTWTSGDVLLGCAVVYDIEFHGHRIYTVNLDFGQDEFELGQHILEFTTYRKNQFVTTLNDCRYLISEIYRPNSVQSFVTVIYKISIKETGEVSAINAGESNTDRMESGQTFFVAEDLIFSAKHGGIVIYNLKSRRETWISMHLSFNKQLIGVIPSSQNNFKLIFHWSKSEKEKSIGTIDMSPEQSKIEWTSFQAIVKADKDLHYYGNYGNTLMCLEFSRLSICYRLPIGRPEKLLTLALTSFEQRKNNFPSALKFPINSPF